MVIFLALDFISIKEICSIFFKALGYATFCLIIILISGD